MTSTLRFPYVVGQWVRGERFYGRRNLLELLRREGDGSEPA